MAKSLIETLSAPLEPGKYADRYQEAVMQVIDRKIKHLPPAERATPRHVAGPAIDLLAVLQESIRANADKRKKPAKAQAAGPARRDTGAAAKKKRVSLN